MLEKRIEELTSAVYELGAIMRNLQLTIAGNPVEDAIAHYADTPVPKPTANVPEIREVQPAEGGDTATYKPAPATEQELADANARLVQLAQEINDLTGEKIFAGFTRHGISNLTDLADDGVRLKFVLSDIEHHLRGAA